jgi:hypothetical protein
MNAEALKARIRNLANKKEIDPQALMQLFLWINFS